ncbi:MAG TPA: SRPBCC family protein, partial [Chthoniobacteraceae bacterium]
RAISDPAEFAVWFRVELHDPFVEGKEVRGRKNSSEVDGLPFWMAIVRMEPERYFAYRWHPLAVDPKLDYSSEPTTLVEFQLEDAGQDTLLTITESGFDQIPVERRAEAFRRHGEGWAGQANNLAAHVHPA